MTNNPDDIRYQEALRRYQVDVAQYETDVRVYKYKLRELQEGDIRPARPIPPIPPVRPVKLVFANQADEAKADVGFNEGVETAALSLETVGEHELAAWVRKQKK